MSTAGRQILVLTLVSVYFLQGWLVYTDPAGRATPALSEEALVGRGVWLRHNCQSCHQIYGFGGFLGPDLTNADERLTRARIDTVLTVGAGQMPAFHLDEADRRAVGRFLAEVHATGRGQLPPVQRFDAAQALAEGISRAVDNGVILTSAQAHGRDVLFAQKCIGCHFPNPLSEKKGTDLTTLSAKLGREGITAMLANGIPSKGMPRFDLAEQDRSDLLDFLTWLGASAETIHAAFRDAAPKDQAVSKGLPWFEYE